MCKQFNNNFNFDSKQVNNNNSIITYVLVVYLTVINTERQFEVTQRES